MKMHRRSKALVWGKVERARLISSLQYFQTMARNLIWGLRLKVSRLKLSQRTCSTRSGMVQSSKYQLV